MRNGVPYLIAFGIETELDDIERCAMSIIYSEFEGNKFNWQNLQWEKQD